MPFQTGTFPDAYRSRLANLIQIVRDTYDRFQPVMPKYFYRYGPEAVKGSTAVFTGLSGLGLHAETAENAPIDFDTPVQGYDKTFTIIKWGLALQISDEAFEDDQDAIVAGYAREFGVSAAESHETLLANVLNNGFGTETSADGLSLFNAAHLTPKAGTFRNTPATAADLSMASLEQMFIDMGNVIDQAGRKIRVTPKWLSVPTEFHWLAMRLIGSSQLPQTANNDLNPAFQALQVDKSEYYTDLDAWFGIAAPNPTGLVVIEKRPVRMKTQRDERSENTEFISSFRQIQGGIDPAHIYGNPGA